MNLPIDTGFAPMEAETAKELPQGEGWQYEPKWDGFRALCFRDGDEADIRSKSGQPMARYFPEVVEALLSLRAHRFVLDGELVVTAGGALSFEALLQRVHPAESRVRKLARETPAQLVLFDLLVDADGELLTGLPLADRRRRLQAFAGKWLKGNRNFHLSPATAQLEAAQAWLQDLAGGLDGIIAKRTDSPYAAGERRAMLKIKNLRSADCVVGGFRYGTGSKAVGSLLLGLYDDAGLLHHVGFTSSIAAKDKKEVTAQLQKLIAPPGFTGKAPGGPSRWSTERSSEWQPLESKLVVEVQYDHFSGGRFRHGTKLLRWRPDKAPKQCKMSQVEKEASSPLGLLKEK